MSDQPSTSAPKEEKNNSDSDDDPSTYPKVDYKLFRWTPEYVKTLKSCMVGYDLSGLDKHLCMMFIRQKLCKELKLNIPSICIWRYLHDELISNVADGVENTNFGANPKSNFLDFLELYKSYIEALGSTYNDQIDDNNESANITTFTTEYGLNEACTSTSVDSNSRTPKLKSKGMKLPDLIKITDKERIRDILTNKNNKQDDSSK